jgi:hypothetical protein
MSAPNQLPHHGGPDQASPTKNENTQRWPLSVQARPSQDVAFDPRGALAPDEYCGAAALAQKTLKQNGAKKISSQFGSV